MATNAAFSDVELKLAEEFAPVLQNFINIYRNDFLKSKGNAETANYDLQRLYNRLESDPAVETLSSTPTDYQKVEPSTTAESLINKQINRVNAAESGFVKGINTVGNSAKALQQNYINKIKDRSSFDTILYAIDQFKLVDTGDRFIDAQAYAGIIDQAIQTQTALGVRGEKSIVFSQISNSITQVTESKNSFDTKLALIASKKNPSGTPKAKEEAGKTVDTATSKTPTEETPEEKITTKQTISEDGGIITTRTDTTIETATTKTDITEITSTNATDAEGKPIEKKDVEATKGEEKPELDAEGKPIDKPATVTKEGGTSASGDLDIYDPNLTQEQLASLSAADLRARDRARDSYFKGEADTTGGSGGEITVNGKPPPPTPYVEPLLFKPAEDWRVRIALGPEASYLYKASEPGILAPLAITDGVIFPYTPTLGTNYSAHYDATHPIHSNYKVHHYSNSSVEQLSLTCDFTAQNTFEANYLLAVIHLFKSATKMFYGKDESPSRGTPPPLFYLYGFGAFQFEAQPFVISNFAYSLPPDVDYIRADTNLAAGSGDSIPYSSAGEPPTDRRGQTPKYLASTTGTKIVGQSNLEKLGVFDSNGNFKNPNASSNPPLPEGIQKGGGPSAPKFTTVDAQAATYVPSRINITITGLPIQSRRQVSNKFSLKDYATGKLIRGSTLAGGGFW